MRLAGEVAKSLSFAPELHALANDVIARMTEGGTLLYNGAHLRIEKDARDWSIIMGGDGVRLPLTPSLSSVLTGIQLAISW